MKRIFRMGSTAAVLGLLGATFAWSLPASAATYIHVSESVNAKTTLATLKDTVTIPQGKFVGSINAANGKLKGNLTLPSATTTMTLAGIGLVDATFTIVPTKPVTGTFNFNNYRMKATSTFNIHVDSVSPHGLSQNLVGTTCETSTPVVLPFSGKTPPFGAGTVSGTYTIPQLANCGLITSVLNAVMAGPGNTFTAQMSPF